MPSLEVPALVGRVGETRELARSLAAARLITITGPGGVGKTQVALRVARQVADRYPGGAHFIELSGLSDPGLLADTVAARLGLRWQGTALDAVIDHLRGQPTLLVLDTCEHIVDACALFTEAVLEKAPETSVLATSRQPLSVSGEHLYDLGPLPVPGASAGPAGVLVPAPRPESLTGTGSAAELFAVRAAAASPSFEVTAATWGDLLRVCQRLDGIPLAIELAAVRLRSLPLSELAGQLDQRLDSLGTSSGGLPRHQTIRAAIEWSYGLCTEAERELWARLSVFAGGFDLPAAREVCAGNGLAEPEIVDLLIELVDKSVVLRDGGRYRMLDTIREFGSERLEASGRAGVFRGRHVARFLGVARDFSVHFLDHDQPERVRALRAEHGNFRGAIQYALGSGNDRLVRDGAELAAELYGYWTVTGTAREGTRWLDMARDALPPGPSAERAWALVLGGFLRAWGGEPDKAVPLTRAGLEMARELGDDGALTARAYAYHQIALCFGGQLEEAAAAEAEARGRLQALGDRQGMLYLEAQTAYMHELSGDLPAALEATARGMRLLAAGAPGGRIGEHWLQSFFCMIAGLAFIFMGGREADAADCFNQALPLAHEDQDPDACAYALEGLGWIAASQERWDRAAWLMAAADVLWNKAGARLGGNPILQDYHDQMTRATRAALGERRYGELTAAGAGHPLDRVVTAALGCAEALNPLWLSIWED